MILLEPSTIDSLSHRVISRDSTGIDQLLHRARLLAEKDKLLLDMAFRLHLSRRQIGVVFGLAPGTITRRIRRLVNRLYDPLVASLIDDACPLPADYRQLGLDYFLHEIPLTELARRRSTNRIEIRAMIAYIRGWHRGLTSRKTSAR